MLTATALHRERRISRRGRDQALESDAQAAPAREDHELRKAREALAAANDTRRRMLDALPLVYGVSSLATGKYLYLNARGQQKFAIRPEDVGSTDVRSVYKDAGERQRVLDFLAGEDHAAGLEIEFKSTRGEVFPGLLFIDQLTVEGDEAMAWSFVDMTEMKQAESALRQARDDAEASTRAKAEFLAAMSHEIRTPMNGVLGMVQLLEKTDMRTGQSAMLATIKDSAFALLQIINDILDFSKIEAGKLEIESVPVSVADVVLSVCETLTPSATDKQLRLLTYIDPAIPAQILGDPVRLRQVLFNVGGNAIKFSSQGNVILRADRFDGGPDAVGIRFSVVDSGIGMSAEQQQQLFQPFSQADLSTTRKFGGTGLGLSICKSLMDYMGGQIKVDSAPGKGSTFTISSTHAVRDASPFLPPGRVAGKRILVVGADSTKCSFLVGYLSHGGAEVGVITTLDEAEAQLQRDGSKAQGPDIIVVDSDWPTEALGAFCRRLLANNPEPVPRIFALVARSGLDPEAQIDGALPILAAPLRPAVLLDAIAPEASPPPLALPTQDKPDASSSTATIDDAARDGTLILVAEDNRINQRVITEQLRVLGYTAEVFDDGLAALEAWRADRHALVLTDCHMPELDGYALTRAIRDSEPATSSGVPIIAVTANALQGEAQRCLDAGMNDYLSKPVEMDKLGAMLERWMPAPVTH